MLGGGSDLLFPHHEYGAAHTAALTGEPFARLYAHAGMVSFEGEKMSKSLGNLVFVSELVGAGIDPRAIRLALLAHHYRSDWEWTGEQLRDAEARLARWTGWAIGATGPDDGSVDDLREVLSQDLDTPGALDLVDTRVDSGIPPSGAMVDAIDALLGLDLRHPAQVRED